jgi:hypothetical protein
MTFPFLIGLEKSIFTASSCASPKRVEEPDSRLYVAIPLRAR